MHQVPLDLLTSIIPTLDRKVSKDRDSQRAATFESHYRISRPLASDDYTRGRQRYSREVALTKRHIQPNPLSTVARLVIDVDHDDAVLRAYRPDLPRPSWIAESPSGRAHVGYLLNVPVNTLRADRRAINLAAIVEEAIRRELGGDPSYGGHLTKNPLHPDWDAHWGTSELHTLANMAEQMAGRLPSRGGYTKRTGYRPDIAGLGRNCLLFEESRTWAYGAVRTYWGTGSDNGPEAFSRAVHDRGLILNAALTTPLPSSELQAIANSVSRWTWKNFTPEQFRGVQQARAKRSAVKRTASAIEQEQAVLKMRAEGIKWQTIADTLGKSLDAAKAIGRRAARREIVSLAISEPGL